MTTIIDFDARRSRFVITAPPWHAALCRSIPNRRWQAQTRTWTAPAIRINADYLNRIWHEMQATMTPAATDKIAELLMHAPERHQHNFPPTYQFRVRPFKHQLDGLNALYGQHSMALFMEMGTGKTNIVINMHAALFLDRRCDAVLVLCPLSVRNHWIRQLELYMPETVRYSTHTLFTTPTGQRAYDRWLATLTQDSQRWLFIGVESLAGSKTAARLAERFLCSTTTAACVVDEAHKIKNSSAQRTKVACKLARHAEWRTIMTGTPVPNSPLDLFAQFEFLDPAIVGLGDFYSFRNRYAIMGGYENHEILGYQHLDELTEIIAPFVYQVRKEDVLDLPPKLYEVREVELTPEQRRLYSTMARARMVATGDKSLIVRNVLEKILRLQEVIGGFVTYENDEPDPLGRAQRATQREPIPGPNPKITEVLDIAEQGNQQTIIWCAFISEILAVAQALRAAGHTVTTLHGALDEAQRATALAQFQSKAARFIVGNAATGGLGLDMTAGTLEIYFSNTYNYADRVQSEDRPHRIGQTKSVTIIDLVARDTIDQTVIIAALREKRDVAEFVRSAIAQHQLEQLL